MHFKNLMQGINGEIMSSDYKYCLFETETLEVQESLEGGILIAVTGLLTLKDDVIKGFSQTFFLAKQENGFFVLNDILQLVAISGFFTNTGIQDTQNKDQVAPTQNSGRILPCICTFLLVCALDLISAFIFYSHISQFLKNVRLRVFSSMQ